MGNDPSLAAEKRRIRDYIEKTAVVMSGAEPDREDLKKAKEDQVRKQVAEEVRQKYLSAPLSDRDREWLETTIEFLKVILSDNQGEKPLRDKYDHVVKALVMGAYARLATDALVEDVTRKIIDKEERAAA